MFAKGLVTLLISVWCSLAGATPQIQHWETENGARVLFVEDHGLPMLDVAVNFPAGSSRDTAARSGVAGLTHHLLDMGAEGLDEAAIARGMADVGAQLGGEFDADRASITLRTLSAEAQRTPALELLATLLQRPAFPETVLVREQARVVAALKEAETKPEHLADRAFERAVFGTHPYALPASGEVATVPLIRGQDLRDFYRTHYRARGAVVALMGDVDRKTAEAIARQLTARLPEGEAPPPLPVVTAKIASSELEVPHPATQSHILIGAPGIARGDPDYFALYAGNYVLGGGGFVSRLMNEVREKRGLAYSVYSYFMPMQQAGAFQIGLQTQKAQAGEAIALVRKTLAEFLQQGPTAQELQAAKQNIIGGFPLRIDSNRKMLGYLSVIGFYGLPLTYLEDFPAAIDRLTAVQVRDALRRHIDPAALATVVVGAPENDHQ